MSRTHKDVPYKVREIKNLKAGKVDHDHSRPDGYVRETYSSIYERGFEKTFNKSETKAINSFREFLYTLAPEYTFTEEENEGYYANPVFESYEYSQYARKSTPKTVTFKFRKLFVYRVTAFCTDYEHYDRVSGTDVRDGGRTTCTPSMSYEDYSSYPWREKAERKEYTRTRVRDRLSEYKALYNSGYDGDDMFGDDDISYNRCERKAWIY